MKLNLLLPSLFHKNNFNGLCGSAIRALRNAMIADMMLIMHWSREHVIPFSLVTAQSLPVCWPKMKIGGDFALGDQKTAQMTHTKITLPTQSHSVV